MKHNTQILALDWKDDSLYFIDSLTNICYYQIQSQKLSSFTLGSNQQFKELTSDYSPFLMGYPYYIKGFKQTAVLTTDLGVVIVKFK